jgi:hypothetical protein
MKQQKAPSEFDFALVIDGVPELTTAVEDALFTAGCDDATFSIQYGHLYAEFSRTGERLEDVILSAINDIQKAGIGATVLRVDECDLVTPAEIARRIGRSRQLVFQYITGQRGPGNFPAPECYLSAKAPLWRWCAASYWLAQNNIIRPEDSWNAEVVAAVNNYLESLRQRERHPDLVKEIAEKMEHVG